MAQAGTATVKFVGDYSQMSAGLASVLAPSKMNKVGLKAGLAIGGAFAAAGAAKALVSIVNTTKEFEKQMSSLGAVSEASRKQMKMLEKQALRLGSATAYSATEAAVAQTELAKGGLAVKEILGGGLKSALALAAAGELELGEAAATTVNAMKLFELQGKDTMKVADMLATAANTTTADVRDFAMALTQGGSVAKQAGYDLNDTVTVLEALAEAGIKNSDAGTSMKAAFLQLLGPTDKQAKLAKQLGLNFIDQNGEMKNAAAISKELRAALGDQDRAQRVANLKVLAGTDGFRTLAALYDSTPAKLDKLSRANERQGTAAEVAKKKQDNLAGDMEKFGGEVETLQVNIGQKLNPAVRDMTVVFTDAVAVLNTVASGNAGKNLKQLENRSSSLAQAAQALRVVFQVVGATMKTVVGTIVEVWKNGVAILRGLWDGVKASFRILLAFLKGDWRAAWKALKDAMRAGVKVILSTLKMMTLPFRAAFKGLKEIMKSTMGGAWSWVENAFATGANTVIGFVNAIISALNKIPGVDIGEIGKVVVHDPKIHRDTNGKSLGRQRGGPIDIGKPSGDSVPALLEKGEYVLNRKAVAAVGRQNLDAINFKKASRFQKGGPIGLISGGDVWDAAKGAASGAVNLATKGPNFFIDKLPKPEVPQPFTPVGPWAIKKATDYIKDKVNPFSGGGPGGSWSSGPGNYPGVTGDTDFRPELGRALSAMSKSVGQSIFVQSGNRTYAEQVALWNAYQAGTGNLAARPGTSNHEGGRAADITPGSEVFGGAAGRFGLGFTVPGESWHIELLRLGGFVKKLMRGGPAEHRVVKTVGRDLLSHGFDFKSTAGILGNAWREGLWNPSQMEFTGADNGGLYGFTAYEKSLANLRKYAASVGKPWDDAIVQNHFMMRTGGNSIKGALNALDSIPDTAKLFMDEYERPLASAAGLSERVGAGYDAAKILQGAGITKPGDEGKSKALTDKQKDARKSANRKKNRESMLQKLWGRANNAETLLGKKGGLKNYIKQFAMFGDLTGGKNLVDPKAVILDAVRDASSTLNPAGGISRLMRAGRWMQKNVDVTGDEEGNEKFVKTLERIQDKVAKRTDKKRKKTLSKISGRGLKYPLKGKLINVDKRLAFNQELLQQMEQEHSSEWSPGGSDLSDSEIKEQVAMNKRLLSMQNHKQDWIGRSLAFAGSRSNEFRDLIAQAQKKGSPLRWKLKSFKDGLKNSKSTINDLRENLTSLSGLTGRGGEMADTRYRLKELGVTVSSEQAGRDALNQGISIQDILQIVEASKYNVFDQMPKFHTGGVFRAPAGQTEGPALLRDGEVIVTPEQAVKGAVPNITVIVKDGAVDPDKIAVIADGRIVKHERVKDQRAKAGVRI